MKLKIHCSWHLVSLLHVRGLCSCHRHVKQLHKGGDITLIFVNRRGGAHERNRSMKRLWSLVLWCLCWKSVQLNTHRFRPTNRVWMLFLESTAQKYGTCITCELGKCNLFLEPVCICAESRFAHRASLHLTSLKSALARLLAFKQFVGSTKFFHPLILLLSQHCRKIN